MLIVCLREWWQGVSSHVIVVWCTGRPTHPLIEIHGRMCKGKVGWWACGWCFVKYSPWFCLPWVQNKSNWPYAILSVIQWYQTHTSHVLSLGCGCPSSIKVLMVGTAYWKPMKIPPVSVSEAEAGTSQMVLIRICTGHLGLKQGCLEVVGFASVYKLAQ